MKVNYEFVKKNDYKIGFIQENIEMIIYSAVCFFVPFFIGHPQLLVGAVVNASLILSAMNLRSYRLLPVIMLPSLAVLSRGIIFGPFTVFLLYMIPFIWIGNSLLVYAFKAFNITRNINKWITLLIGAFIKAAFLFATAFLFVKLGILPKLFLTTMGIFQFYTAILGGTLALGLQAVKKKITQ